MVSSLVDKQIRDLLTPEEIESEDRAARQLLDSEYPKPDLGDIEELKRQLDADWSEYLDGNAAADGDQRTEGAIGLKQVRDMRYQRDRMPAKWQRHNQTAYRFRSRLTHNEIMRVVAMMTRNRPKVNVPPAGPGQTAQKRADKQTRWANEVLSALERQAGQPLWRPFCDAVAEASLGVLEVYLNGSYDDIDDPPEDDDAEAAKEYNRRLDDDLKTRGLPFSVRVLDPETVRLEYDDEGLCKALIIERKRYKHIYAQLRRRLGADALRKAEMPDPFAPGYAPKSADGDVECIRYYDRRWTAYIVDGVFVEEPAEHTLPGVPIIDSFGLTTSSSRIAERLQGVTWGMVGMEQALNDLLTLRLDIAFTFGRPKIGIETDIQGALRDASGRPGVVDLSGDKAIELNRGQKFVDITKDFTPQIDPSLEQTLMMLFQRSGLNPVAMGDSPGADPSGFAINSLQAATNALYETTLDNVSMALGKLIDFIRVMIRDTIDEKVYLSVPVADKKEGGTEWLGLGPDDVDETPCEVYIDPLNDVNRLAIRDSLMAGFREGHVPRRIVQMQGFGAEDPDEWNEERYEDQAEAMLFPLALQEAMAIVQGAPQTLDPMAPAGSPGQQPDVGSNLQQNGGAPAEPQGASVGKENSGGGGFGQSSNRARGGQAQQRSAGRTQPERAR